MSRGLEVFSEDGVQASELSLEDKQKFLVCFKALGSKLELFHFCLPTEMTPKKMYLCIR